MKKYTPVLLFASIFVLLFILIGFSNSANAQVAAYGGSSGYIPPTNISSTGVNSGAGVNSGTGVSYNNSNFSSLPAGCTSTIGYSSTTGIKCDTYVVSTASSSLPAGCSSTIGYSPLTGVKCDAGISTSLPAGCYPGYAFSATTGVPCTGSAPAQPMYPPGCTSYNGFSTTTGNYCNGYVPTQTTTSPSTTTNTGLVITGVQGYDASYSPTAANAYTNGIAVVGKYLVVYGTFPSSGNTVIVNTKSYTPIYQSITQLNVFLDPSLTTATGTLPLVVSNGNTESNIWHVTINPAGTTSTTTTGTTTGTNTTTTSTALPVVTGVQGYNATTNVYTNGVAVAGKYLVVYGTFTDDGNVVIVQSVSSGEKIYTPIYQSAKQINVLLDPTLTGSWTAMVSNANGGSNAMPVTINAN